MDAAPRSAKRQRSQSGGSGAAVSGAAAAGPLAGVAVFVRRNSLHSGAQLDAWKRSVPALGGTVIESEAACGSATHAVVPSGSRGGWACLPAALRPGGALLPPGLQYVAEHWLAACIKSRARVPECDFAPAAAAAAAGIAMPAAAAVGTVAVGAAAAAAAAGAAAVDAGAAVAAKTVQVAAVAQGAAAVAATGAAAVSAAAAGDADGGPASSGAPGDAGLGSGSGAGSGSDCSSDEEEEASGDPGRCSEWYAREAGQLRFAPERHPDDHVTWSLLSWNIWDVLDRQCLEPRALEIGREVERNEFPDAILLQEVSGRMLGLLSRQPWQSAYHRSPLPGGIGGIGRCCTMILLRKDRVGPPPGHSEVQWLEPYVCSLNDTRLDVGFQRDVKGVRCTILGRPVRISTTHIIHDAGGRRQWREITSWLSQQDAVYRLLDVDCVLAGDLNWHYHEPMPLPPGWVDVWPLLMPHNSGHTWSSLARTGKATGPARLDRVVAKLHSFRPIQIDNLTGSEPIEGAVRLRRTRAGQTQEIAAYASDHRGLFTRFQLA